MDDVLRSKNFDILADPFRIMWWYIFIEILKTFDSENYNLWRTMNSEVEVNPIEEDYYACLNVSRDVSVLDLFSVLHTYQWMSFSILELVPGISWRYHDSL